MLFANPKKTPHLLAGNHDTVVGSSSFRTDMNFVKGTLEPKGNSTGGPRPRWFKGDGAFMEHGHQWDDYNVDNAPIPPFTRMLVGRNAPSGELITQIALIRPQPARQAPTKAAKAAAALSGQQPPPLGESYSDRLKQLAFAAEKLLVEGGSYCYVMGHTHSPLLTRVRVRPGDAVDQIDKMRAQKSRPTKISAWFDTGADAVAIKEGEGRAARADVAVSWKNVLAHGEQDWYSLEDPAWPKGTRRRGFWNWIGYSDPGSHSFHDVPPGLYRARYYAAATETEPFATSPLFGVYGISIDTNTADDDLKPTADYDRPVVQVDGDKIVNGPIPVRFAVPAKYEYERLSILLAKKGDNIHPSIDGLLRASRQWDRLHNLVLKSNGLGGRFYLTHNYSQAIVTELRDVKEAEFTLVLFVNDSINDPKSDDAPHETIAWTSFKVTKITPKK